MGASVSPPSRPVFRLGLRTAWRSSAAPPATNPRERVCSLSELCRPPPHRSENSGSGLLQPLPSPHPVGGFIAEALRGLAQPPDFSGKMQSCSVRFCLKRVCVFFFNVLTQMECRIHNTLAFTAAASPSGS